jgi:hypothetical protein
VKKARDKKLKTKLINYKVKNKKNWMRQRRKKLEKLNEKKATAIIEQIFPLIYLQRNTSFMIACIFYHPFINPIVNPADMLPVNGIPKFVIANAEAVAVAWLLSPKPGICIIIAFESVVIVPSDTV